MSTTTIPANIQAHRVQYCADLLSSALEGGSGYWARVRDVEFGAAGTAQEGEYVACKIKPDDGPVFDDGDPRNDYQRIDLAKMAEAIERLIAPGSKMAGDWIIAALRADWNDEDSCEYDAETADVVVQVALFGEIVFG